MPGPPARLDRVISDPLVQRARGGDLAAAGDLLAAYQNVAYTAALRLVGQPTEAEDLAQEALVQAYTHLSDLREGEAFGPWLRRIAVNLSLNLLRRRGRIRFEPLEGDDERVGDDEPERPARDFPDEQSPGLEELALRGEWLEEVDALLRRLPDEQRVALILRDVYDYDVAEIAALQRCGLSAAKMRVTRARAALRRLLIEANAGAGGSSDGPAMAAARG